MPEGQTQIQRVRLPPAIPEKQTPLDCLIPRRDRQFLLKKLLCNQPPRSKLSRHEMKVIISHQAAENYARPAERD